jgi:membrane protein DedA with SNARE-associated domain
MNGAWPYLGIFVAAMVEGEIAYVGACALVAAGQLNAGAVIVSGALGAAIGDQAYFFIFRGRLHTWVARFPALERKTAPLVDRVRRNATLMVLLIRFAPGLRIALAAACAYVDMPALRFSILNAGTAFIWAAGLMVLIGWAGPAALNRVGLGGWIAGAVIVLAFKLLGRFQARSMGAAPPSSHSARKATIGSTLRARRDGR